MTELVKAARQVVAMAHSGWTPQADFWKAVLRLEKALDAPDERTKDHEAGA